MKIKSVVSFALLIFSLAIVACEGSDNVGSGGNPSGIFTKINYDTGQTPVVAGTEKSNVIIELHDDGDGDFYYHVGTADLANNLVDWGPSHLMGVQGINPTVAVSEGGVVAEAHGEAGPGNAEDGNIVTTIGIVNNNQISWGSGQVLGKTFYNPAICITRDGKTAVLVYEGNKYTNNNEVTLRYRVGKVDAVNKTISWGPDAAYDGGIAASISINNRGHIITVHSSWQNNTSLWYKVGQLNADNTVNWGPTVSFNLGERGASVSIGDDDGSGTGSSLFLVYPGRQGNGALWLSTGNLPTGSTTAQWPYTAQYGSASTWVKPACTYAFNRSVVEVHDSGTVLSRKLWYGFLQ
jgi:hypothetical protein